MELKTNYQNQHRLGNKTICLVANTDSQQLDLLENTVTVIFDLPSAIFGPVYAEINRMTLAQTSPLAVNQMSRLPMPRTSPPSAPLTADQLITIYD